MQGLSEQQKIELIFKNFRNTMMEHTKYTIGHEPVFKKKIIEKYKTPEKINIALLTLRNLPSNIYLNDSEVFRIIDYNLKFKEKFKERIEKTDLGKNITLKYASTEVYYPEGVSLKHTEAPFQINVYSNGKEIGSFNFIFVFNNKERMLLINLVQGKKNISKESLKEINKALGNWKQKIVENLVSLSKSFKAKPVGVLPTRFKVPGVTTEEYSRIIKTYIDAFIHGGIEPKNISFENVKASEMVSALNYLKSIKKEKPKVNLKEPLWKKIRRVKH